MKTVLAALTMILAATTAHAEVVTGPAAALLDSALQNAQQTKPVTQPAAPAPQKAPEPAAKAPQQAQPQTLPLRIVNKDQFCTRLSQMFAQYGSANGFDQGQTALLASTATVALVQEFRAGRVTDYINASALASLANAPARAQQAQGMYLPIAGFIGQAMGLGDNVTLALGPGELRFIPFAQKGIDMVLIAQNAASLTPERARKVAEVANSQSIHIHVIWVGAAEAEGQAIEEARSLAWLAAVTGGGFANLSGSGNPCANQL